MFQRLFLVLSLVVGMALICNVALAGDKGKKKFNALITDIEGMQTNITKVKFYWEEKLDETSFVPHEIQYVPVKQGKATVEVKFDKVKRIKVKPNHTVPGLPLLTITLTNGKSGNFPLARELSLIGKSDFGKIHIPIKDLKTIEFK